MGQVIRAACVLAMGGIAGVANADSVYLSFDGTSGNFGQTVTISLSGGLFFADGGSTKSMWAGQLSHTIDGDPTKTYCTELTQWAHSGVYDIVPVADAPSSGPMGQARAEAIYRLFNATNGAQAINTGPKAAAFQALIWEIVYDFDSGTDLTAGKVQFSGVSTTWFDLYAGYANDLQGDATAGVIAYTNTSYQDQLGLQIVPLPGTAAMAALGLGGIAARRRRHA